MIPMCDTAEQYRRLKAEIDAAMQGVAESGQYILGPEVKAFEREIADYCGVRFAVGVNSGTDALHLALRALGIGPGDEVITTPFTFVATTEAIGIVGATPVFVDIDPATFNLDVSLVERAITPRTRALLPVHLFGHPCEMAPLLEIAGRHNLQVVEDCAQSLGARYHHRQTGTFGAVGCYSFFPSKNLGAIGDAGMLVTDDPELAARAEMLRRHGGKVKYHHSELGLNSRLDELQAAILRVKLRHLDEWIAARRRVAFTYNAQLVTLPGLRTPRERLAELVMSPTAAVAFPEDQLFVAYHQYTVLVSDRAAVQTKLKEHDVSSMVYYPVPLHRQEVHASLGYAPGDFPQTEWVAEHCLSLPIFPEMREAQQEAVIAALSDVLVDAAPLQGPAVRETTHQ